MKKNKFLAVILAMAVAVGAAGVTTYAVGKDANDTGAPSTVATAASASDTEAVKDETVYVMTAADGSTQKILVSDWIKNALPAEAQKAIESLNDAQQVKDDCWTGTIQKELPVSMSIHYTLDGKTVTPSELAGKSGKVTIRFEYENKQYEVRTVNGVSQKVYVPFVALTGALLDTSHFSNVTVSNGKLINDGDRIAVMGMAFPGLQEDLGISKEQLDLPDYVEISADVTDFTLETTLTVVSNSLLNEVDTDDLTSGDLGSLSDSLGKLTDAMDQLMDGSSQLYDGLCTLLDSCGQLSDGVDQLTDGLNRLSSNSGALNAGAKQVFTSLLAMADEQLQPQLAQAGITIPSLTIDNYNTVLGGVLAQLDKAGTLAEQAAREQVTAAVEAARDQIRAAVTEAVQQQVTAQVTEQVRQQVLGQVLNAMGYTMEQYQQSPELKAQVDAAVEMQVQTPAMQQTISENVTALMGTEEIRQKIDAATEQQVQLKIEETMASDEVQQKIMAATEQASAGAVQIRSLKQQLDQYNVFYMGLNSYTAGVDQAAAGARRLQSNMPALLDGVKQLRDGAMQLTDGLKQFNEEGVEKLVSVLGDDVEGLAERLTATVEVSRNYRSFSGLTDGMDGAVRFIYRTEAVEKAE